MRQRLHHKSDNTGLHAFGHHRPVTLTGHHDHRRVHQSLRGLYVLCRRDVVRVRDLHIHQGQVGLGLAQQAVRVPVAGDKEHLIIGVNQ